MARRHDWFWRILAWFAYEEYRPGPPPGGPPPPPPPPRTPSAMLVGARARYVPPSDEAWRLWEERLLEWAREQRRLAENVPR